MRSRKRMLDSSSTTKMSAIVPSRGSPHSSAHLPLAHGAEDDGADVDGEESLPSPPTSLAAPLPPRILSAPRRPEAREHALSPARRVREAVPAKTGQHD